MPSTFDGPGSGPPAHCPAVAAGRTLRTSQTRRTGGTRGVGHGPSNGRRERAKGQLREIPDGGHEPSNHESSASSRWRVRPDSSRIDRIASRHREAIFASRGSTGRRSTSAAPSVPAAVRSPTDSRGAVPVCAVRRALGNRERSASGRGSLAAALPAGILAVVPGSRRGDPDRGGHAIARSGRVVRPVRRPTDRQAHRRNGSGDPREICNQDPDRLARAFSILVSDRARPAGAR